MPTYNQGAFIRRAIKSLCEQTYKNWELIIVNDGCTDNTEKFIADYLISHEYNVRYIKNKTNEGIGFSINKALEIAQYPYIAYLPSDDFYEPDHLLCFKEQFDKSDDIVLVYSGLRFDRSESKNNTIYVSIIGVRSGYSLQLVQAAHKKTEDRWIERGECVSEDLFFTFWHKLTDKGIFVPTKQITCEWTNHPNQRHKITGEKFYGGLNIYRDFYKVKKPIRYRNTNYKITDEIL
jgi:glycosyltransferase involved in cell wall biosynthesis